MRELDWRLLVDAPAPGAENMARDHALARCLGTDEGVLRFYGWDRPTISFGRNEPTDAYDRRAAEDRAVAFVRRPSGGRAVLHHREVTYTVVVPERAWGGPREAYRRIHEGLVQGVKTLGVPAQVAEEGEVLAPDQGPCFRAPAPGEIVLGGRKLVGSAQVRLEGALLQHGSLLLAGDQGLLAVLRGDPPSPSDRPATLEELEGGEFTAAKVVESLSDAARLAWAGSWRKAPYRREERSEAGRLLDERYGQDSWTWRR